VNLRRRRAATAERCGGTASSELRFSDVERKAENESGRGGGVAGVECLCAHCGLNGRVIVSVRPPRDVFGLAWLATNGVASTAIIAQRGAYQRQFIIIYLLIRDELAKTPLLKVIEV